VSTDDGLGVAESDAVCIVRWCGAVDRRRFARQRVSLERVVVAAPGRAGFVCEAADNSPPPDDGMRKASVDMIASFGKRLKCVACVIEGAGFRGAMARSVLSGMVLLLSSRAPDAKIAATYDDVVRWVAAHTRTSATVLLAMHAQLRKQLAHPS
jgi:hypothetical protein